MSRHVLRDLIVPEPLDEILLRLGGSIITMISVHHLTSKAFFSLHWMNGTAFHITLQLLPLAQR